MRMIVDLEKRERIQNSICKYVYMCGRFHETRKASEKWKGVWKEIRERGWRDWKKKVMSELSIKIVQDI